MDKICVKIEPQKDIKVILSVGQNKNVNLRYKLWSKAIKFAS
jgi:hypothetical protein